MIKREKIFFACRNIYIKMKKHHLHILPVTFILICKIINRSFNSGIPINDKIDVFIAPHGFSGIFISKNAIIGKNCTIFQQVTIGSNELIGSKHYGAPIIGDNVYIGAGAKIIGNCKIGNNVKIGANCVVTESIESDTTVVTNYPRIIKKKRDVKSA